MALPRGYIAYIHDSTHHHVPNVQERDFGIDVLTERMERRTEGVLMRNTGRASSVRRSGNTVQMQDFELIGGAALLNRDDEIILGALIHDRRRKGQGRMV